VQTPLLAAGVPIAKAVWGSLVVGCDETSTCMQGTMWWQWVLPSLTAVFRANRLYVGGSVVTTFLSGAQPAALVVDRWRPTWPCVRQMCRRIYGATRNRRSMPGIPGSRRAFDVAAEHRGDRQAAQ